MGDGGEAGPRSWRRYLGEDEFPVEWKSELEKELFWVFDDLHCPHPLSPMFDEIGGWWLTCDHMFRRFGTPFAVDWITKNVNGYLYTAAIPADRRAGRSTRWSTAPDTARACRSTTGTPATIGKYLDATCRSTASTSSTGGATGWCRRCSATSTSSRRSSTARTR